MVYRVTYVDTWVQADLIHNCDSSILALLVEFQHGWRDIAGCDDMLLLSDGTLDNCGMECVGNKRDD